MAYKINGMEIEGTVLVVKTEEGYIIKEVDENQSTVNEVTEEISNLNIDEECSICEDKDDERVEDSRDNDNYNDDEDDEVDEVQKVVQINATVDVKVAEDIHAIYKSAKGVSKNRVLKRDIIEAILIKGIEAIGYNGGK